MEQSIKNIRRHYFLLNPYEDMELNKCPKCQDKTNEQKFPLVIRIYPQHLFVLNKWCHYCIRCELIMTNQSELEFHIAEVLGKNNPDVMKEKYLVMGTLKRKYRKDVAKGGLPPNKTVKVMYVFKDVWHLELKR